jgi:hypothetical protein
MHLSSLMSTMTLKFLLPHLLLAFVFLLEISEMFPCLLLILLAQIVPLLDDLTKLHFKVIFSLLCISFRSV